MKCHVTMADVFAMTIARIGSKDKNDPDLQDVPPALLNAHQRAEYALDRATTAILAHLKTTGQATEKQIEWLDALSGDD